MCTERVMEVKTRPCAKNVQLLTNLGAEKKLDKGSLLISPDTAESPLVRMQRCSPAPSCTRVQILLKTRHSAKISHNSHLALQAEHLRAGFATSKRKVYQIKPKDVVRRIHQRDPNTEGTSMPPPPNTTLEFCKVNNVAEPRISTHDLSLL